MELEDRQEGTQRELGKGKSVGVAVFKMTAWVIRLAFNSTTRPMYTLV